MDDSAWRDGCKNLQKWGSDKPLALVMPAVQIALAADDCHQWIQRCRANLPVFSSLHGPATAEWMSFYDSTWDLAAAMLIGCGESASVASACIEFFRRLSNPTAEDLAELCSMTREEFAEAWRLGQGIGRDICAEYWRQLADDFADAEQDIESLVQTAAGQHFLGVAFPCWILTGHLPEQLLASPSPDRKKLRTLFRLDTRVAQHPKIQPFLYPTERHLAKSRRQWLATTLKGPLGSIGRKQVRYRLSRLIIDFADRLAFPLKTPQVEELFKIVASMKDRRQATLVEREIQPGTFLKLTNNHRHFWALPPKPDKSASKALRALRKRAF